MVAIDEDQVMTILGTIGGFAISLSLVPQVYMTYKTKCADDISYSYQFIYILGTALVNAYAIYFELYAVFIPCLLEFALIVTLTIMKAMYPSRTDLIDCSRHSILLSTTSKKGGLSSINLAVEELIATGELKMENIEGESNEQTEIDPMMLRKSISMIKQVLAQGDHHHIEANDQVGTKKVAEDVTENTGSSDHTGSY